VNDLLLALNQTISFSSHLVALLLLFGTVHITLGVIKLIICVGAGFSRDSCNQVLTITLVVNVLVMISSY